MLRHLLQYPTCCLGPSELIALLQLCGKTLGAVLPKTPATFPSGASEAIQVASLGQLLMAERNSVAAHFGALIVFTWRSAGQGLTFLIHNGACCGYFVHYSFKRGG